MPQQFQIQWIDRGREPQCPPNPAYPQGLDLDYSQPAEDACCAELPYPARRIGIYVIECRRCGLKVGVTTAGRPDDPRSVTLPCKPGAARRQEAARAGEGTRGRSPPGKTRSGPSSGL